MYSAETKARAIELIAGGTPKKEVATAIGVSLATVYNWAKGSKNRVGNEVGPDYLNPEFLTQPRTIWRVDNRGDRNYYTQDEEGNPNFYLSVTSFLKQSYPMADPLLDWYCSFPSRKDAEIDLNERADYGTVMHCLLSEIVTDGIDLSKIDRSIEVYVAACNRDRSFVDKWSERLTRNCLAFLQWINDYEVQFMGVEVVLASDRLKLAGAIDFPVSMVIPVKGQWGEVYKTGPRKGQPKETTQKVRVNALVDAKSREDGNFYPSHGRQLHIYGEIWKDNFPAVEITHFFNWSPKDWRKEPGYNLKDQTELADREELLYKMEGFARFGTPGRLKAITTYRGTARPGVDPKSLFSSESIHNHVRNTV